MNDVIASEWLKIRTVRSTTWLLVAMAAVFAVGCVVATLMVADWDSSPPDDQAHFATADPSVFVLPFVMFCLAAFGGLAVTTEYGTGMIRSTLTTVPRRLRLFAGKAVVIGAASLLTGLVFAFLSWAAAGVIVGDRPQPLAPWPSMADGVPGVVAASVTVTVVALVGYGVGTAVRSVAGTLVAMTAWVFVLPVVATMLPSPWNTRFMDVLPLNLASRLTGDGSAGAAVTLAVYVVAALGVGAVSMSRRDA